MKARIIVAVAATLVCTGAAQAAVSMTNSPSVSLSSHVAGARVAVTLQLRWEMQCNYPGPGPVIVHLPTAERVPASLKASDVLVDGKAAPSLSSSGHTVTVGLAPEPKITCDEMSTGTLTIAFTRAAGLANPSRAGLYTVTAARANSTFAVPFTITKKS